MPTINLPIQQPAGPLVQVIVGVSMPRQTALKAAGQPVPQYVKGTFLIDTGASCTCIDPSLISKLGIPPTGTVPILTPSTQGTPHSCNQYDVMLFLQNSPVGHVVQAIPVIETSLSSQGIDGLLGRDFLAGLVLIYNGTNNSFMLSY